MSKQRPVKISPQGRDLMFKMHRGEPLPDILHLDRALASLESKGLIDTSGPTPALTDAGRARLGVDEQPA